MIPSFESKVCSTQALSARLATLAKPIVFTNGVFDILHRGHVSYLDQARALGASLVVGVNSDASVRLLGKGNDRPLNSQEDRMALLAALAAVDVVVMFEEKTPVRLLERIQPEFYVKGGDYVMEHLEETQCLKRWGGQARAIPFLHDRSTTSLLARARAYHD
ncbi:MAG: D-glycero-beta-D-manno-heptose 1-phosphate adenylyltransferase [Ottowia sp.]|nr:D-glycero-beta-D-manno-heptose 1-phosphate adenylyltransferase [Ottowia sp.]